MKFNEAWHWELTSRRLGKLAWFYLMLTMVLWGRVETQERQLKEIGLQVRLIEAYLISLTEDAKRLETEIR